MTPWMTLDPDSREDDLFHHPFYQRGAADPLSGEELALYAAQHAHIVRALAVVSRRAADLAPAELRATLTTHGGAESEHVALWADSGRTVSDALPPMETAECISAWDDPSRDFDQILTALYAIKSAHPQIAETKLQGMPAYGLMEPGATAYFELHRAVDYAAAARAVLERWGAGWMAAEGERAWVVIWGLLDGVDRGARVEVS